MPGISIQTTHRIIPMVYAYSTPEIARHDGHLLAVARVAPDRQIDRALILRKAARYQRVIDAIHRVVLKLGGKGQVRIVILRNGEKPACVLVDAVHDAGAKHPVNPGKLVSAMI